MGSQEDSLDQGLAGKSQLWAAVSSLSVGACKESFTYRGPGQSGRAARPVPHSPSPSPEETGAGVPLGGGGMPDGEAGQPARPPDSCVVRASACGSRGT